MIVKMNLDGVIEKTYGSRVFKGSNAVTEIALFAPFDPQSTVIINFTLPDGTEIPGIMTFADFSVEDHYNMWVYKLRQNVTSMEGRVTLSFEIRAYVDETEVTTTAETHIYIEKSSSTTFLDEVDEFFELANEALTRSQQALNLNQATNEALEIEIERNNEQDNAIEAINQTLINQQNAINEHGNELEILRQETNEAIQREIERNNEQDNAIAAINQTLTSQQNVINDHGSKLEILSELPSRINSVEHNIGVLNNQMNAMPKPQDILTKQNYTMPEGYAPTQPHHLADKKYVDDVVEAMSGINPEHFVTHAQLEEALYKPDFFDLTITEPVYHIEEATLDSPKEIQVIEGSTVEVDGQLVPVKNPVIESVGRNLFDWEHILRNNPNVSRTTYDGRDCLSWRAGPETSSHRFLQGKFKPNTQYTISGYFAVERGLAFLVIFYTDGSFYNIRITSTTFEYYTFTTQQGKTVDYLRGVHNDSQLVYLDINTTMLNEGTTPLPYEPFRSTKLAINGEYHQWDKIINDGGVYYDEIGSVEVNMWEYDQITMYDNSALENVYRFIFKDFVSNLSINKNYDGYINKFELKEFYGDERGARFHPSLPDFEVFIEKPLIQAIMTRDSVDEVTAFKTYLEENNIVGVFQLANPTRRPTSILKAGDPDFSQGSTIYLHSDTEAIPTVHAKVAMDIAGQVDQLTKDSRSKSKKLHDHDQRIKANEIAIVDLEQAINTEVSDINQTIDQVEGRIEQLETDIQNTFVDTTYTISNGHLTFYRKDGTTKVLDLPLEMIIESGRFDEETNTIILTMANQQTIEIPVGAVVTDISEALHDVEENLSLTQAELNQLQTDINNSITAIQNELNKKITLNPNYSAIRKEYAIGTILPVYATILIDIGAPRYIKVRYSGGSPNTPIGFAVADLDDPDRLNGTWNCIGQCGENYYLFQRLS